MTSAARYSFIVLNLTLRDSQCSSAVASALRYGADFKHVWQVPRSKFITRNLPIKTFLSAVNIVHFIALLLLLCLSSPARQIVVVQNFNRHYPFVDTQLLRFLAWQTALKIVILSHDLETDSHISSLILPQKVRIWRIYSTVPDLGGHPPIRMDFPSDSDNFKHRTQLHKTDALEGDLRILIPHTLHDKYFSPRVINLINKCISEGMNITVAASALSRSWEQAITLSPSFLLTGAYTDSRLMQEILYSHVILFLNSGATASGSMHSILCAFRPSFCLDTYCGPVPSTLELTSASPEDVYNRLISLRESSLFLQQSDPSADYSAVYSHYNSKYIHLAERWAREFSSFVCDDPCNV